MHYGDAEHLTERRCMYTGSYPLDFPPFCNQSALALRKYKQSDLHIQVENIITYEVNLGCIFIPEPNL
jgi:hypothetical protein